MTVPRRTWIAGGVGLIALVIGVAVVLSARKPEAVAPPVQNEVGPEPGVPWFVDVTRDAGIDFVHFDPTTDSHFIQETMGSGLGWIDYDADGWPDLFCIQDAPVRPTGSPSPSNRLYRNNRNGTFTDVTEKAGLVRTGFGQGCAVGDFDNDGFDDLAVTYLGALVRTSTSCSGRSPSRRRSSTPSTWTGYCTETLESPPATNHSPRSSRWPSCLSRSARSGKIGRPGTS